VTLVALDTIIVLAYSLTTKSISLFGKPQNREKEKKTTCSEGKKGQNGTHCPYKTALTQNSGGVGQRY